MKQQNNLSKLIYFFVSLLFLASINIYYSNLLSRISQIPYNLFPFLRLNYMENNGAAFSILQNSKLFLIVFGVIAIFIVGTYIIKNISRHSMLEIFFVSMLISGIGCNLYERLVFGLVRDYFELTFIHFPIFNISDIYINIGAIVIMCLLFTTNVNNDV